MISQHIEGGLMDWSTVIFLKVKWSNKIELFDKEFIQNTFYQIYKLQAVPQAEMQV